ncbi:MAG: nuclear transport factor 2 family protein [Candidatus Schekmanbacteria bacterium]|nr:nuclear transport factor 2 family protein [Candidatus Schekmanbacteria bacterium]
MERDEMLRLAEQFMAAWNSQEVERVLSIYTSDVEYVDPNTRGAVRGADALRKYLTKLFAGWTMHWSLREAHLFEGGEGCAVLWHATFRKPGGSTTAEADGMDFVRVRDGRIQRNEVYFDRAVLSSLMAG